jgi:hypothetical protein
LDQIRKPFGDEMRRLEWFLLHIDPPEPDFHCDYGPGLVENVHEAALFIGQSSMTRVSTNPDTSPLRVIAHETAQKACEVNANVVDFDTAEVDHTADRISVKENVIVPDVA